MSCLANILQFNKIKFLIPAIRLNTLQPLFAALHLGDKPDGNEHVGAALVAAPK